jgi:hypothetical protein
MTESLRSVLLGTAGLGAAAVAALLLTLARGGVDAGDAWLRAAVCSAAVATIIQAVHFAEELATGFHRSFPEVLGLAPWSDGFFVAFNLLWLTVWAVSVRGLWFLAIAAIMNGLGHPLLALRAGSYFPGLITAPFLGVAGVLLFRALVAITYVRATKG